MFPDDYMSKAVDQYYLKLEVVGGTVSFIDLMKNPINDEFFYCNQYLTSKVLFLVLQST